MSFTFLSFGKLILISLLLFNSLVGTTVRLAYGAAMKNYPIKEKKNKSASSFILSSNYFIGTLHQSCDQNIIQIQLKKISTIKYNDNIT